MGRAALIKEAAAAGRPWVVLFEQRDEAAAPGRRFFHRLEMHIPSGVVIESAGLVTAAGRRYRTRSYFVNRETGEQLACGSRIWNEREFSADDELATGLEELRAEIAQQFAGLTKRWEERQRAARSGEPI